MSVSDPLLKDLKGHVGKLLIEITKKGEICDTCSDLQPFCEALEKIFQQGLNECFSVKKPESWTWMENVASHRFSPPFSYSSAVSLVCESSRVQTDRGRLRLLIRTCLVRNSLHFPVELLVQNQPSWRTYQSSAILGDEILGQIFLSVLLQCSKLKFALNLSNSPFLDETWALAPFEKLEFVPCKELGLCVSFNGGRGALVVRVQNAGVAAEDDKVQIGDFITEINGHEITSASRTKLNSIMRQASGSPVQLSILRARFPDGKVFPLIQKMLLKHDIRLDDNTEMSHSQVQKLDDAIGYPVQFIGQTSVGSQGDVGKISGAINKVMAEPQSRLLVLFEVMELGVKVADTSADKIFLQHTYMEISSCGKSERLPEYFAYIAGDTNSCNTATDFMCYVFCSQREDHISNIVYSIADDMGWGDLGANLPHLPSSTPFLDSLANEGIRFLDFHSSASVCTPSRAALMTGRLGLRTGVVDNIIPDSVGGLPSGEITLAQMLKTVGYRTAAIGKWHLGLTSGHHPLDHGFDTFLGVPFSLDMGCSTPPGLDVRPKQSCETTGPQSFSRTALPLFKDRDIMHQPVKLSSLAQHYSDFGTNFIESDTNTPFFLYAAFNHVHVPLAHGESFSNATTGGLFSNCLYEMDWIAENLVSASAGRDTLVWFLSDNGAWEYKCSLAGTGGPYQALWQKNPSGGGGGSGSKTTLWEGGHRVPSFIHWPSRINQPQVSDALISATDIVPTIASLTGASLPMHRLYDGIDISNYITKGGSFDKNRILLHPSNIDIDFLGQIGAVRIGPYKAVYHTGGVEGCGQEAGPFQVLLEPIVFDLSVDPEEQFPLSGSLKDEVTHQAEAALQAFLDSVRADNTSTFDPQWDPDVRPCCSNVFVNCFCPWDSFEN